MSNILDYVKWRSDITLDMMPLNEIDSLIFTELCYLPFEHLIPSLGSKKKITLSEAADRFLDIYDENKSIGAIIPGQFIIRLLRYVGKTLRFSDVKVWGYVNDVSTDTEKQFSAMCFSWGRNTFIAFRGTDDTLIGWKEDLNMALYTPIPAQTDGVNYAERIATLTKDKLYIGGHSKGGNIAVYTALNMQPKYKKRLVAVYNFDGPGFTNEYLDSASDPGVENRIYNFLPSGSVIGRIFDSVGEVTVVKSYSKGIQQHDAFSWCVMGTEFVGAKKFDKNSDEFHDLLKSWVYNMPKEDRHKFVEAFYRIVTSTNASTLSDILVTKMKFAMGIISASGEDKKVVFEGIKQLIKEKNAIKDPQKVKLHIFKDKYDDTPMESVYFLTGKKKNK